MTQGSTFYIKNIDIYIYICKSIYKNICMYIYIYIEYDCYLLFFITIITLIIIITITTSTILIMGWGLEGSSSLGFGASPRFGFEGPCAGICKAASLK